VQAVAQCGNYGDPPSAAVFVPQMLEFVSCVVVGRVACGLMVWVRVANSPYRPSLGLTLSPDPAAGERCGCVANAII